MTHPSALPYGEANRRNLWSQYRRQARLRGLVFELSLDEFSALATSRCFYCGARPVRQHFVPNGSNGPFTYNGIDRVDNRLGYTLANAVPCCRECNQCKRARSYAEFVNWASRIATRHQGRLRQRAASGAIT